MEPPCLPVEPLRHPCETPWSPCGTAVEPQWDSCGTLVGPHEIPVEQLGALKNRSGSGSGSGGGRDGEFWGFRVGGIWGSPFLGIPVSGDPQPGLLGAPVGSESGMGTKILFDPGGPFCEAWTDLIHGQE